MTNEETDDHFHWQDLGDLVAGRPRLGATINLAVYRLMQYTVRDELAARYGREMSEEILAAAGRRAGTEFCRNMLDTSLAFSTFIAELQERMHTLSMGILRMEKSDLLHGEFVLTLDEDLDCSGMPVSGTTLCRYDEGFLAAIFTVYTGRPFFAREIDCWATGARTCRFLVKVEEEGAP